MIWVSRVIFFLRKSSGGEYHFISRDWGTNQIARKALFTGVAYTNLGYFKTVAKYIWGWGCAARSWKPLPYFRPKYTIFHTLFQTRLSKCIRYFRPCNMLQFRQLSIGFTVYGTSWRPNDVCVFFFFAIQCPRQHVTAKNGIPDQTGGIYTLFQTKRQNLYPISDQKCLKTVPFGAAHNNKASIWEYPPPPPRVLKAPNIENSQVKKKKK